MRTHLCCTWSSLRTFNLSHKWFSRYRIGEAWVHLPHARALKKLEKDQASLDKELSKLKDQAEECEKEMKGLKVILYAKFGKAINLDE